MITVDNILGIQAGGAIGSSANPLDVNVRGLAVGSAPAIISANDTARRVPEVQAVNFTIKNIITDPVVAEERPLIVLPQNNVNLVESVIDEMLEEENNEDKIYNENGWYDFGDDQLGLRKRR